MLHVDGLSVAYGESVAVSDVSFRVAEHEVVTLIGPNGAGKSTILRTIAGLSRPVRGRLVFRDREISGLDIEARVRLGISLVPEGRRLFPGLTVIENLEMGAVVSRRRQWRADVEEIFDLFPGLRERRQQLAWSLSGGQQQMLAIGRALMTRPSLLLMDEPSLGLAPMLVKEVFKRIAHINAQGTTVVVAEQNARAALQVAHQAFVLVNGRIELHRPAAELVHDRRVAALYLGGNLDGESAAELTGGR